MRNLALILVLLLASCAPDNQTQPTSTPTITPALLEETNDMVSCYRWVAEHGPGGLGLTKDAVLISCSHLAAAIHQEKEQGQ